MVVGLAIHIRKMKRITPIIIAGIIAAVLLLFLAVFILGRSSDSTSINMANQKLSEASIAEETLVAEPWRNDVGTLALEKAGQAKVAEQAAEAARIAEEAKQEAALQAATVEKSCDELMAEWEARFAGVPSAGRSGMPCGPYAGYSSAWTAGQAQWEAMTPEEQAVERVRRQEEAAARR